MEPYEETMSNVIAHILLCVSSIKLTFTGRTEGGGAGLGVDEKVLRVGGVRRGHLGRRRR